MAPAEPGHLPPPPPPPGLFRDRPAGHARCEGAPLAAVGAGPSPRPAPPRPRPLPRRLPAPAALWTPSGAAARGCRGAVTCSRQRSAAGTGAAPPGALCPVCRPLPPQPPPAPVAGR